MNIAYDDWLEARNEEVIPDVRRVSIGLQTLPVQSQEIYFAYCTDLRMDPNDPPTLIRQPSEHALRWAAENNIERARFVTAYVEWGRGNAQAHERFPDMRPPPPVLDPSLSDADKMTACEHFAALDEARATQELPHEAIFRLDPAQIKQRLGVTITAEELKGYERAIERMVGYSAFWRLAFTTSQSGFIREAVSNFDQLAPPEQFTVTCLHVDFMCPEPLIRQDARSGVPSRYSLAMAEETGYPLDQFKDHYALISEHLMQQFTAPEPHANH